MKKQADRAHTRGDFDKAERLYRKILDKEFDPVAAGNLGTIMLKKKSPGEALHYLEKSVQAGCLQSLNNLGIVYKELGRHHMAVDVLKAAIEEEGNKDHALNNLGSTYHELGDNKEAEKCLRECIKTNEKHVDGHWNLSLALLSQGKFRTAWEQYDWGFKASERQARPWIKYFKEWFGEPLDGKTILIWGEQGIGDEILFANCFKDIIKDAKQVILDCHPRLEKLFKDSFPEAIVSGTRKSPDLGWIDDHHVDYHCPMGSIPRFYRTKKGDFPKTGYLKAEPAPKSGPRVGLSWRGGGIKTGLTRRSMTFHDMAAPLVLPFQNKEVEWVSLQYGRCYEEIEMFEKKYGAKIVHNEYALENYNETAKLVASCDLVISVITAVVHLAGGLNVPTWCMVPIGAPWKFTPGPKNIWHPSVKQYWQEDYGVWDMSPIASDFRAWLGQKKAA